MKPAPPKTEAEARAALAAGQAVPLEWLWLLDGAELTVTNPGKPGKTLEVSIEREIKNARNED